VQHNEKQITQAWRTFHKEFGLNIIPAGHEKVVAIALEAHTDPNLKAQLADYLNVAPAQALEVLRGYLKQPTFANEIRKLLGRFIPSFSEHGFYSIPSLSKITGIRKSDDKNSYLHFYNERISDEVAEKLINTYGEIATGIALLLREEDQLCVLDFDDKAVLIELLTKLGYPCDEANLEDTLLRAFPQNPIVATFRGFHIYGFDPDLAEAVKTRKDLGKIEVRVAHCYMLLPPSLAGFEPQGATLNLVYYRQVRPLLPETIRAPLPAPVKDYLFSQIRPQTVSTTLSFTPTQQAAPDLKSFIVDNLVPYWKRGMRDGLVYPLAGVLRRAGITLNEALDIVSTICDRAGDEEKRDRLYQTRRQYSLPFQPNGNSPYCAGISKFREACLAAGMPLQVFNSLIARIFGLKVTTNLLEWLEDNRQIAEKIAAVVRNDLVFNETTMSWWVYRDDQKRWVETKREDILHYIIKATLEVRNDIEELVKMSHDNTIPKQVAQKLNKILNSQFIRNSVLPTLEVLLSVNFTFPHIPTEVAETLPAPITRITAHLNGVLLWLANGDTIFYGCDANEGDPHRRFFITQTLNSVVKEGEDATPFIDYIKEVVDDKETAEYLLQVMATVLGLRRNPFKRFLLFLGDGRNGKNSLIQIVKAAFGSLVEYTTTKVLTSNAQDNAVLSAKYALRDCAFAIVDEAPSVEAWDIEIVKQLAGGDEIVVKKLYRDTETIPITWINIVLSNEYPSKFKRQSHAIADRIIAVNFPNRYSDRVVNEGRYLKRQDEAKVEALKQNTPATIEAFRWAFKRAALNGFKLTEPQKIKEFAEPIRQKADTVGYFLDKCTEEDGNNATPLDEIYDAYKNFVRENDLGTLLTKKKLSEKLLLRNFKKEIRKGVTYIVGLRLKENGQPDPQNLWADNVSDGNGSDDGQTPDDGQDYLDDFPF
jgi:phage/plasmid-associated DNA primase